MVLRKKAIFRTASFFNIIAEILLRLLRIWPVYSLMFIFYWKYYIYFLDGPISGEQFNKELDSCDSQWPFMLTLVTNFTYGIFEKYNSYCMGWFWYIPNDFQYCIIGIFLIYSYARSETLFYILWTIIFSAFTVVEGLMISKYDVGVTIVDYSDPDYFKYFYFRLYTRAAPFFIGLLFGVIYSQYKHDDKNNQDTKTRRFFNAIKESTGLSAVFYIIGLGLILTLTFGVYWMYGNTYSFGFRFMYNILVKKLWVLGLYMFALPLMLGNFYIFGGWLGASFFVPLSKLTFSVYIVHPLVVKYLILNSRTSIFITGHWIIMNGVSFIVASYGFAILVCGLFEMPFQNVRDIFKGKSRGDSKILAVK